MRFMLYYSLIKKGLKFCILLIMIFFPIACSNVSENPSPTTSMFIIQTVTKTVTPSTTRTPSADETNPTKTPAPTYDIQDVLPTFTPVTYSIVQDDTLIGIALKFGVTLDEILLANPGIDPNFLTIRTTIIIPGENGTSYGYPTPTPLPVSLKEPHCYSIGEDEALCYLAVENELDQAVENITAMILVKTIDNSDIQIISTFAPLNKLDPGKTFPLTAFIPNGLFDLTIIQTELISALPVSKIEGRFLNIQLQGVQVDIHPSRIQASVFGKVFLPEGETSAEEVWVITYASDIHGNIIGYRKWKSNYELTPGNSLTFEMNVFSLGPPITSVNTLAEAFP